MQQFTKLGNVTHYTDILFIGIATERSEELVDDLSLYEKIASYSILHCKLKQGKLIRQSDVTYFDGYDVFLSILSYYQLSRQALLVVNNSLVFLGSSDLISLLDNEIYKVAVSDMYADQLGIDSNEKVSQLQFIASAPPTVVGLQSVNTKGKITIVDIANYGIKDIGRFFMDFDINIVKEFPQLAGIELSVDKSDTICIAMYLVMKRYCDIIHRHKLGPLALTYASQAMRCYRGYHYDNDIVKHNDERVAYVEERCYIGGRCECNYRGWYNGSCYLIDLNSLYASIGVDREFPKKLCDVTTEESKIDRYIRHDNKIVFAHCQLSNNVPNIPVRIDGEIEYPIGNYNAYICGSEFREAWISGSVTRLYFAAVYDSGKILKSYSEHMLKTRGRYKKKLDKTSESMVKFITNGLWGKFAEIGSRWIVDDKVHAHCQYGGFYLLDEKHDNPIHYRVIAGESSKLCRAFWTDNTFLPITSVMNSYCRSLLWRYMQFAGKHNVLYCAIDGLIVTEEGYNNLKPFISDDPEAYGKFKLVEKAERCYIHGKGRYKIGSKIAMSGVPQNDQFKYRGFWNCKDDAQIISASNGHTLTMPYRRISPQAKRLMLGEGQESYGEFISPVTLDQPSLSSEHHYQRDHQSSFRFDDFLQ